MGVPFLGIQSLEKIFLHYGFKRLDLYFYPAKKLDWLSGYTPPSPEILANFSKANCVVQDLSENAQHHSFIHYTDEGTRRSC
jgi:hypothetical protein